MAVAHNPGKHFIICEDCGEREEVFTMHAKPRANGKNRRRYCERCIARHKRAKKKVSK